MLTAENTAAMVMGALEYQPDSYLTKPLNINILKSRLDKAIIKKDLLAPISQLLLKRKYQEALTICDEIKQNNPKYNMACLRLRYKCLVKLKHYDQALELTTKIINQRPLSWAMLGVGEIFFIKQDYRRASDTFNEMIREFPSVLEGYDWLAKLQYMMGQPIEAQKTLIKAVERSPKALKRQKLLGKIAEENEDIETMTEAYRQAVRYGLNSAFAHPDEFVKLAKAIGVQIKDKGLAERKRLVTEAESVFRKIEKRFKDETSSQFRGAVAHADFCSIINNQDKVDKYLRTANRLYARVEEHIGPKESIEISTSLKQLGQNELAECILEEAVEQHFDDLDFINQAAKITNNKHLIENSKKANHYSSQAIQHFKQKEYSLAIDCFSKSSDIAPNNVNINLNKVQALLKHAQGNSNKLDVLEQAELSLNKITRLSPKDPRYARYSELSRLTQLLIQNI